MGDQTDACPFPAEAVNQLEQRADVARAAFTADLASGVAVGTPFNEDTMAA
ncbi:MAG: hypothetical protein L0I76_25995 [Pseudonocardia sp.]|nr:hypothetical protein [Pseudonocardia sp.]